MKQEECICKVLKDCDELIEKIKLALEKILENRASDDVLRSICKSLLNKGFSSEELLDEFEDLRNEPSLEESYEDILLDAMDSLYGWCSPKYSLAS